MACEASQAICTKPGGGCTNVNVHVVFEPVTEVAALPFTRKSFASTPLTATLKVIVMLERELTVAPKLGFAAATRGTSITLLKFQTFVPAKTFPDRSLIACEPAHTAWTAPAGGTGKRKV